jgi:uncharacterized membrane protein
VIHDSSIPVFIHIVAGTAGILTGFVALFLRKGTPRHRLAGNVFVVTMILMGSMGAWMAFVGTEVHPPAAGNVFAGLLSIYMVSSAWLVGVRRDRKPGWPEYLLFLIILGIVSGEFISGRQASLSPDGLKDGYPAVLYYIFGSLASIALVGDVLLFLRRGIQGVQRLARHLWRMCFALLLAANSLFLGQPQVFPEWMHRIHVLFIPGLTILVLLIYHLIRTLFTKAFKDKFLRPSERVTPETRGTVAPVHSST